MTTDPTQVTEPKETTEATKVAQAETTEATEAVEATEATKATPVADVAEATSEAEADAAAPAEEAKAEETAEGATTSAKVVDVNAPKERTRGRRRTMRGYVVSDKMQKTIVVEVEDRKKHRLYSKVMRTTSKYKVHDETNTAGVGDLVRIIETRPLSATKRFRLLEIIERAK